MQPARPPGTTAHGALLTEGAPAGNPCPAAGPGALDGMGQDKLRAIMVIDDDAPLARMLSLTLRYDGYAVQAACNGHEALDQMSAGPPDLIVLDLEMPVMDGRTFFRELRARGWMMPVLVVSAYEARKGQRELGAEAYLNKPFNPEELLRQIRRLLP